MAWAFLGCFLFHASEIKKTTFFKRQKRQKKQKKSKKSREGRRGEEERKRREGRGRGMTHEKDSFPLLRFSYKKMTSRSLKRKEPPDLDPTPQQHVGDDTKKVATFCMSSLQTSSSRIQALTPAHEKCQPAAWRPHPPGVSSPQLPFYQTM